MARGFQDMVSSSPSLFAKVPPTVDPLTQAMAQRLAGDVVKFPIGQDQEMFNRLTAPIYPGEYNDPENPFLRLPYSAGRGRPAPVIDLFQQGTQGR